MVKSSQKATLRTPPAFDVHGDFNSVCNLHADEASTASSPSHNNSRITLSVAASCLLLKRFHVLGVREVERWRDV